MPSRRSESCRWLKANPLDAQHPENGAFTDLYEHNNERINKLVLAYAEKKDLPQGSDGRKIGALYRLYMDSVSRNRMGYEPIMPYLRQVREVQTRNEALRPLQQHQFPRCHPTVPFFDPEADYVCNYGAIGAVIGHEMTHGFGDQGCQFDKDGNLANWWTAGDPHKSL